MRYIATPVGPVYFRHIKLIIISLFLFAHAVIVHCDIVIGSLAMKRCRDLRRLPTVSDNFYPTISSVDGPNCIGIDLFITHIQVRTEFKISEQVDVKLWIIEKAVVLSSKLSNSMADSFKFVKI